MKDNNMREILFRGKTDRGEWIEGFYIKDAIETYIYDKYRNTRMQNVLPKTVGQYTGLTDKNGKKIFDGDIVKYKEENGKIVYHDQEAMFVVCFDTWFTDFDHLYGKDVEIVGKIHDNPELLEGGEEE